MFVADALRGFRHYARVLDSKSLIAELQRLKDAHATSNADLGRLISQPSSRIAEIFNGKRRITIDEMKILVEHFGLEGSAPSADMLEPILDALLPIAPPPGRMTDQSRRALAEGLSYGLASLGIRSSTQASGDVLAAAARAAVRRFRELGS